VRHVRIASLALVLLAVSCPSRAWEYAVTDDLSRYFVTYRCGPKDFGCSYPSPQLEWDKPGYVRYDIGLPPRGYQTSQSALAQSGYAVQTWIQYPFTGGHVAARGDGGQLGYSNGDTFRYVYTVDGSDPGVRQWFCGDGWVAARSDAAWNAWRFTVPRLSIVKGETNPCTASTPTAPAYTRYKLVTPLTIPAVIWGASQNLQILGLVTEHYDAETIAASCAMERTVNAWHWGMLTWESWNQCGTATPGLELDVRCPPMTGLAQAIEGYPAFKLMNCRRWTNFVMDPQARALDGNGIP
jgi:hypothetical protein